MIIGRHPRHPATSRVINRHPRHPAAPRVNLSISRHPRHPAPSRVIGGIDRHQKGRKLVLFNICGPPICFGAEWAAAFYELNSEKFIKHKNKEITQNCNQNSIAQTNIL